MQHKNAEVLGFTRNILGQNFSNVLPYPTDLESTPENVEMEIQKNEIEELSENIQKIDFSAKEEICSTFKELTKSYWPIEIEYSEVFKLREENR